METLIEYLKTLTPDEQVAFAKRCGTSIGYLRKAAYTRQNLGVALVMSVEQASKGKLRCEVLRPDIDWQYAKRRRLTAA